MANALYCPDVLVNRNAKVFYSQQEFLSNTGNKEQLIQILSKDLLNEDHTVINCNIEMEIVEFLWVSYRRINKILFGCEFIYVKDNFMIFIMKSRDTEIHF